MKLFLVLLAIELFFMLTGAAIFALAILRWRFSEKGQKQ
jgi:hypothetical protein